MCVANFVAPPTERLGDDGSYPREDGFLVEDLSLFLTSQTLDDLSEC